MRRISIKELGKHLSAEMANLPFAVMKRGKFIGVMVAPGITQGTDFVLEGTDNKPKKPLKSTDNDKSVRNTVESTKKQLTNIVKKKQKVLISKTTIPTRETSSFGYTKSMQVRKK